MTWTHLSQNFHYSSRITIQTGDQLMYYNMHYYYYYYRYSALGPVWAETRAQSFDWYGSGTPHPGQVLRDSLPLLYCYIGIF